MRRERDWRALFDARVMDPDFDGEPPATAPLTHGELNGYAFGASLLPHPASDAVVEAHHDGGIHQARAAACTDDRGRPANLSRCGALRPPGVDAETKRKDEQPLTMQ